MVNTIEYKRINYTTICIDEHSHVLSMNDIK
jgi:hypothetical protein